MEKKPIAVSTSYVAQLQSRIAEENNIKWALEPSKGPNSENTKVFYTDMTSEIAVNGPESLIERAKIAEEAQKWSVCVIENISPEYIEAFGSAWDLDIEFFVTHASNPKKEHLWDNRRYTWDWDPSSESETKRSVDYGHLDGIYEYFDIDVDIEKTIHSSANFIQRHCFRDARYPAQSTTRISYYRVNRWLYLFLVDAPLDIMDKYVSMPHRSYPTLRLLYTMNRGGLELPQLLPQRRYSLFESFKNFSQHAWHGDILFDSESGVVPPHPLIYMLSSCLWEYNLRFLARDIKRISFQEIQNPSLDVNALLHAKREDLARLKTVLLETNAYVPAKVQQYFKMHNYYQKPPYFARTLTPIEEHQRTLEEAIKLEAFLMETFQLFMSSVMVQDSRLGIQQARRSTMITQLAFIYIPLSFITGVFGMNLKELNNTGLDIWVFFVGIAGVLIVTLTVFWILKIFGSHNFTTNEQTLSVV